MQLNEHLENDFLANVVPNTFAFDMPKGWFLQGIQMLLTLSALQVALSRVGMKYKSG